MNKIPCTSLNTKAKTLPADVCIFGHLDGFHLPLSTQLTSNLTSEWSDGFMFHPFSHVYAKTHFCCIETVANNALNWWHIVVFDGLWANVAPTLNTAFSLTNVHTKWWIHSLLISSTPLLSHPTSIYDRPKQVCGVFWCFLRQLLNLGELRVQHICMIAFKVNTPLLNCCFWWSRVRITLNKPLLCLNIIFSHQKAKLNQHTKIRFFHCFENLQQ